MSGFADQQRRDAIVEEYDDTEPCRHDTRFWCEACVTDAYKLHSAIGHADGAAMADPFSAPRTQPTLRSTSPTPTRSFTAWWSESCVS